MTSSKKPRHARDLWKSGSAKEFLDLSDEEAAFVEVKLALTDRLRKLRGRLDLSQHALAKRLGSSQSRVAKMEAGDRSVSLDLLVRSLLALGDTPRELARVIGKAA